MSELELEKKKNRIYEIQTETEKALKQHNFKRVKILGIELNKIRKELNNALKQAKKGGKKCL